MTWFRIDDSFGAHPKVLGIPRKDRPAAIGLWTLAGVWCARNLTDGYLASHMLDELGVPKKYATMLVAAGLWEATGDGFRFHDWTDHQPSRAEVEQRRKEDRDRKAAAREGKKAAAQARANARGSNVIPYDASGVNR